jgi:hypothetical protein
VSTAAKRLRQRIAAQARHRCGYCLTLEVVSGIPLTLEHLTPKVQGGADTEDNLWLSCRLCNESKGIQTEAADPETGLISPLFNPRRQIWSEHFTWIENDTEILGLSPMGRATIAALGLNSELRVRARALWVEAGWHPPATGD